MINNLMLDFENDYWMINWYVADFGNKFWFSVLLFKYEYQFQMLPQNFFFVIVNFNL